MSKKKIHTLQELHDLQQLPLDFKVEMTKDRIRQFYEAMGGSVCVAFSGGKDSTVLLHIVRSIYPDVKAVYACTGVDYPSVVKFVHTFSNVDYIYPLKHFGKIIKEDGIVFPSKDGSRIIKDARRGKHYALACIEGRDISGNVSRYKQRFLKLGKYIDVDVKISDVCCDLLKEKPMADYGRRTGLRPMIAIMAVESARRQSAWLTTGCNIYDKGKERSKPMSFWTEQDVLHYIVRNNVKIADVYGDIVSSDLFHKHYRTTGEQRTGCMFCAVPLAHGHNRLTYIKEHYPKIYDTFINRLGLGDMFEKLGLPRE